MAPGLNVDISDWPKEVFAPTVDDDTMTWQVCLSKVVRQQLNLGKDGILNDLAPVFERVLLDEALKHTGGHRQNAAKRLGWGRNTLTRKFKELGIDT